MSSMSVSLDFSLLIGAEAGMENALNFEPSTQCQLSLCIFCNIKILFPHIYDYGTHWMLFVNMLLATVATSYMPRIHYSLTPSSDCARL